MDDYCSKCGKKLGILSTKYKSKDGSVLCLSCLKENKMKRDALKRQEELKQKEKNQEIMNDIISKYLVNKDTGIHRFIRRICCEAYWFVSFFNFLNVDEELTKNIFIRTKNIFVPSYAKDSHSMNQDILDKARKERPDCVDTIQNNMDSWFDEYSSWVVTLKTFIEWLGNKYQSWLKDLESSIKPGLTTSELDEIKGQIMMCEVILDFIDDLEKMGRLFEKKGIDTNYFEILSIFSEVIGDRLNSERNMLEKQADKFLEGQQYHEKIPETLKNLGLPITKENVIKIYLMSLIIPDSVESDEIKKDDLPKKYLTISAETIENVTLVSKLLNKFNFTCEPSEVEELIAKVKEDIELEQFEQRLGTPPQEQRIEIGDFTELNGYEFEDYLKRMFELLGYTAVQTPTTGDQGADLILSKDDDKIVVHAKKYEGKVSNKAVQEIAAAKNHYNADKAMIVTNSSFTKSAMELALSNDVELWDGTKLRSIIRDLEKNKSVF